MRKRLAPLDGRPGRSVYGGGAARFETDEEVIVARPPFGLDHERDYPVVRVTPLLEEIERDRLVAVLLVRLGGYAVGVLEGERLVASKVGSRFVKGRHKKGGSSSNRFRRRREEQARALVGDAAETAARVLQPWRERVEFAALGGDRRAVADVLAAGDLRWLDAIAIERFFAVPDPRQRVLEALPYDLYAVELAIAPAAAPGDLSS